MPDPLVVPAFRAYLTWGAVFQNGAQRHWHCIAGWAPPAKVAPAARALPAHFASGQRSQAPPGPNGASAIGTAQLAKVAPAARALPAHFASGQRSQAPPGPNGASAIGTAQLA